MNSQTLTRQELYNLVWSNPFTTLAKKYSISDVGLRKICIKMEIPLPKSGHWEKVRFNKTVEIIKLPSNYLGETEITLQLREEGVVGNSGILSELATLTKAIENSLGDLLVIPERLSNPSKLISAAKNDLTQKRNFCYRDGLSNTYGSNLHIHVSQENVSRALRFMNTFIKACEKRGHRIETYNNKTCIVVEGKEIQINIREKLKKIPKPSNMSWQEYDFVPTGILLFNARIRYSNVELVKDGKLPVETQLSKLIAKLELEGKRLVEERIMLEKIWAEQREQKRIEDEIKERRDKELADFKQLLQNSKQWQEAETMRSYINEVERKAGSKITEELKNWLVWARKKADWYDPQIKSPDELLDKRL